MDGNPASQTYWKKIIDKDISIFDREGIELLDDGTYIMPQIDIESELNPDGTIEYSEYFYDSSEENPLLIPSQILDPLDIDYPDGIDAFFGNESTAEKICNVLNFSSVEELDFAASDVGPLAWNPTDGEWERSPQNTLLSRLVCARGQLINQQDWINSDLYHYPVLPRHGNDGRYLENDYPYDFIPSPLTADIYNENQSNENLLVNISSEEIEPNVLNDNSGNNNKGFVISDYKPLFDSEKFSIDKTKKFNTLKKTKKNRAF
jgi:hypothetical protein